MSKGSTNFTLGDFERAVKCISNPAVVDLKHIATLGLEAQIEVLGHTLAQIGAQRLLHLMDLPDSERAGALATLVLGE